jgi:hypothetical protein
VARIQSAPPGRNALARAVCRKRKLKAKVKKVKGKSEAQTTVIDSSFGLLLPFIFFLLLPFAFLLLP